MNAIFTVLSLVLLFVLTFVLWNQHRVDNLRQELFAVRDRLFDEARAGKIAFHSHAYRNTRLMLNGLIRFGHRTSLSNMLAHRLMISRQGQEFVSTTFHNAAFSDASETERKLCAQYINEANVVLARHLLSSPTLYIVMVPLITLGVAYLGGNAAATIVKRWKKAFAAFDRAALEEGRLA